MLLHVKFCLLYVKIITAAYICFFVPICYMRLLGKTSSLLHKKQKRIKVYTIKLCIWKIKIFVCLYMTIIYDIPKPGAKFIRNGTSKTWKHQTPGCRRSEPLTSDFPILFKNIFIQELKLNLALHCWRWLQCYTPTMRLSSI